MAATTDTSDAGKESGDAPTEVTSTKLLAELHADADEVAVEAKGTDGLVKLLFDSGGFSGGFIFTAEEADALLDDLEAAIAEAEEVGDQ